MFTVCEHCGKDTLVVEKGCNVPLTAVSQDFGDATNKTIKNALKRLKEEFGYGIKDVYQESGEEQESL